jgi:dTDP-4-amino-4,6-dideoxygalactose transaminase
VRIPYVDLAKQNQRLEPEILPAVSAIIRRGDFILGEAVAALEQELAAMLGVPHVVGVSNGTDALVLALHAAGIGQGDEVVIPSHSFVATASAVALAGAVPVFVDVDAATMLIDPKKIEAAITDRTRALIPVHLNGHACAMDPIVALCRAHGLTLIEDCAQAIGTRYRGRHVGTFGVGCFSMHPLKALAACGDAGFIATADDRLASTFRELRNLGLRDRDHCALVSGNHRLDTMQAAILSVKLRHFPEYLAARRHHAQRYAEALHGMVTLPPEDPDSQDNHSVFVIRHPKRDLLYAVLRDRGIDVKIHYPLAIHQQDPFAGFLREPLPATEATVATILSLPVSPELSEDERETVIAEIRSVIGGS